MSKPFHLKISFSSILLLFYYSTYKSLGYNKVVKCKTLLLLQEVKIIRHLYLLEARHSSNLCFKEAFMRYL
jgi:hypothetical protein